MMMFGVTYDTLTGEPIVPDSIFYKTGRKAKIHDWICEEVIVQSRQKNETFKNRKPVAMWVTTDALKGQPVYAHILRAMMGPLAQQYASFFDQMERLGGYPAELHTQVIGMDISQKLKVLKTQRIDDSIFQLPDSYKKNKYH